MEYHHEPLDFYTTCGRAGIGEGDSQPLVSPIAQSTTYCRDGIDSTATHQYSRVSNPNVAALEVTLGQLERAPQAACFANGLAAETVLLLSVLNAGDHWVCGQSVYGGTTRLGQQLLPGLGIETSFVDATDLDQVKAAIRPNTKLVFIETPANPTLETTDIGAIANVAKTAGALLAVDNTFLTAVLQQPLEHGADVSVYSTTKFIEGHSVALGGALVCREPALLDRFRFIRKCTGTIQSPFNAWLTLQGIKTLPLRIRRQSETAETIANLLAGHSEVARVCYPTLLSGSQREIADRQHDGAHGAVVSLELKAGATAARAFVDALRLCRLVEHVGSVETLVTHPASMTHGDVPRAERIATGISDGLLRLSIGLEDVDAIHADLLRGLDAASARRVETEREGAGSCA
jgi:cystathionine beta-lyase/cystathionine gamma-synthase